MKISQRFVVSAISRYQNSGGGGEIFRVECNFEPSCSEYAKQAVSRYGAIRGTVMSVHRLYRCSVRDQVTKTIDPVP